MRRNHSKNEHLVVLLAWTLALLAACTPPKIPAVDAGPEVIEDATPPKPLPTMGLRVLDELGAPVAGAVVRLEEQDLTTDPDGMVALTLDDGAISAVVSAEGMLAEPVVIGMESADEVVSVRLLSNAGGTRWTMHAGGDVMFGRRYNEPPSGEPLIPRSTAAEGARAVVSSLRNIFTAADVRTLNLETVISNLSDNAAYPGKRFILNAWPETLAGVQSLEPSFVLLANNHARDYLDLGVTETMRALDAEGILYTGASDGPGPADTPLVVDVAGVRLGTLAFTTVDGSFVNDNYPLDEDTMPAGIAPTELWQWTPREWGFTGETWSVPVEPHRIGTAWRLFDERESFLSEEETALAWASMVAVYPELQDWVARRGHGGAAPWLRATSPARITALKEEADLVAVQLHAGFQFQPAPSDYVVQVAHQAIDAGADIVICHHPHVLQGAEWYKDKLIVFSLGNFIFDQDFFATFSTAFLRTVWEGATLIEARFIPLELVGYRPVPSASVPAQRTLLRLWEMSIAEARAAREGRGIRVFRGTLDPDVLPAQLRIERNTALIVRETPASEQLALDVPAGSMTAIDYAGLVDPRLGLPADVPAEIEIGRDLLGWGDFEDTLADRQPSHNAQWVLTDDTRFKRVVIADDAPQGQAYLQLDRSKTSSSSVLVRPVARTPLVTHRLWVGGEENPTPADPEPSYSVHLKARMTGVGTPFVRLDLYMFDDSNPTEDPSSTIVGQSEVELKVAADGAFHDVEIAIGDQLVTSGGVRANMIMFYVGLKPIAGESATLEADAIEVLEWRAAHQMHDRFGTYHYVRNRGEVDQKLSITAIPAGS